MNQRSCRAGEGTKVKGQGMGIVIDFPSRDAASSSNVLPEGPAEVVILPVIRIERYESEPAGFLTPGRSEHGRKRKRRASRS